MRAAGRLHELTRNQEGTVQLITRIPQKNSALQEPKSFFFWGEGRTADANPFPQSLLPKP